MATAGVTHAAPGRARAVAAKAPALPVKARALPAKSRAAAPEVERASLSDQIEQLATELFIRHGYNGVSYLDISKALGITHSNVHYYFRTKDQLAHAVLQRVARETLVATGALWSQPDTSLLQRIEAIRDWTYGWYLRFNPKGVTGRPWGLLTRFSMEADALTPEMRQTMRATLQELEDQIRRAVAQAVASGEFAPDTPVDGLTLQLSSVLFQTGALTRHAAGFSKLDQLFMWTVTALYKAYGGPAHRVVRWHAFDAAQPQLASRKRAARAR